MAKSKKVKKAKSAKKKEPFLKSKVFKAFMAKLYGWGAAVVILGALFKIMHWKGAGAMLTLGLTTEALIFFISAFDVQHETDWSIVYPELKEVEEGEKGEEETKKSISEEIDKMLEDANIEKEMVNRLGTGMNKFADTVSGIKDVSNAAIATNDFTDGVRRATEGVSKVKDATEKTAEAMTFLSEASGSSKEYFNQIKAASGNLTSLNFAYEKELSETNKHLDVLTKFNSDFSNAMGSLTEASLSSKGYIDQVKSAAENLSSLNNSYESELEVSNKHREAMNLYNEKLSEVINTISDAGTMSVQVKEGFSKLNENLESLNNVYGNMLTAMNPARG
ncbi:MAG: gliding motility protein GldL [Bacteroidota bacterium]|nr:gliding motility protein GldL [Bacteroidota bacterium]